MLGTGKLISACFNKRSWTVYSPSFLVFLFDPLNARITTRKNWTPAQNGRLDGVGMGTEKNRGYFNISKDVDSLSILRFSSLRSPLRLHPLVLPRRFACFFLSLR